MTVSNTELTWFVFAIILVEAAIFIMQLYHYLQRPSDKSRLWYLILLFVFILYNVASGLFPDPGLSIPITTQNILAYGSGMLLSAYLVLYVYLAFDLRKLRRFALFGILLYIIIPYIIIFLGFYAATGNLLWARKLIAVPPFLYGVVFLFHIGKAFRRKYLETPDPKEKRWVREQTVGVYIAVFFWLTIAFASYFGWDQITEQSLSNIGFLIMTFIYVRMQILKSQQEYEESQKNKDLLKEKEVDLTNYALKVSRIEEFLTEFKKRLSEIDINDRQVFRPLISLVHEDWNIEEEMDFFDRHFETIYNETFQKLDHLDVDLSNSEKKHLVYIKIGLSNKEIAALNGTSMDVLRTQRYRLKKKLNIEEESLEKAVEKLF